MEEPVAVIGASRGTGLQCVLVCKFSTRCFVFAFLLVCSTRLECSDVCWLVWQHYQAVTMRVHKEIFLKAMRPGIRIH
jgi:hypothetical protein